MRSTRLSPGEINLATSIRRQPPRRRHPYQRERVAMYFLGAVLLLSALLFI